MSFCPDLLHQWFLEHSLRCSEIDTRSPEQDHRWSEIDTRSPPNQHPMLSESPEIPTKNLESSDTTCCAPTTTTKRKTLELRCKRTILPTTITHNLRERAQIRFNEVRSYCLRPSGKKERGFYWFVWINTMFFSNGDEERAASFLYTLS